jgi:hypothetical protein
LRDDFLDYRVQVAVDVWAQVVDIGHYAATIWFLELHVTREPLKPPTEWKYTISTSPKMANDVGISVFFRRHRNDFWRP